MPKKNNKIKRAKTLISLSILAATGAHAKSAKAQIISFSCPQPLLFGGLTSCGTGPNTVVIAPTGGRTVGGCLTAGGAPFNSALCNIVQGGIPHPVQMSLTSTVRVLSAGANTMTYNNFNLITNAGGTAQTRTGFFASVPIGATLNVPANQPAGTYTGTFTLNVNLL